MNYSWETLFGQFEHKNKGKNPVWQTHLPMRPTSLSFSVRQTTQPHKHTVLPENGKCGYPGIVPTK